MDFNDADHMKVPDYKEFREKLKNVLTGFERRRDWPDLIKAIGQLQKILHKYEHVGIMPEKLLLSKRLGQTLNPSLPSGVHRKVLETYQIIFRMIGPQQLARDLPIYSSGLFKLFPDASMDVKPSLLLLLEEHYMSLPPESLRPCLGGLLCALLPVLEETGDLNRRVEKILGSIESDFTAAGLRGSFMRHIWDNMRYHAPSRLAALKHLETVLPKSSKKNSMTSLTLDDLGGDPQLASQALCVCLGSNLEMVIRGVLDLIVSCFMIHEKGTPGLSEAQMVEVTKRVLLLMIREELPITRRISRWFSGEDKPCPVYFTQHAAPSIKQAFTLLIDGAREAALLSSHDHHHHQHHQHPQHPHGGGVGGGVASPKPAPGVSLPSDPHSCSINGVIRLMDLLGPRGIQEDVIGCYARFLVALPQGSPKQFEAYQAVRTHVLFDHIADALQAKRASGDTPPPHAAWHLPSPEGLAQCAALQLGESGLSSPRAAAAGIPPRESTSGVLSLVAVLNRMQQEGKRKPGQDRLLRCVWAALSLMNTCVAVLDADSKAKAEGAPAGQADTSTGVEDAKEEGSPPAEADDPRSPLAAGEIADLLVTYANCQEVIETLLKGFAETMRGAPSLRLPGGCADPVSPLEFYMSSYRIVLERACALLCHGGVWRVSKTLSIANAGGAGVGVPYSGVYLPSAQAFLSEEIGGGVSGVCPEWRCLEASCEVEAKAIVAQSLGFFIDALNLMARHRATSLRDAKDDGVESPGFSLEIPTEVVFGRAANITSEVPQGAGEGEGEGEGGEAEGEKQGASPTTPAPHVWVETLLFLAKHPDKSLAFFSRKHILKLFYINCDTRSRGTKRASYKMDSSATPGLDRGSGDALSDVDPPPGAAPEGALPGFREEASDADLAQLNYTVPAAAAEALPQRECLQWVLALLWSDVSPSAPYLVPTCEVLLQCHGVEPPASLLAAPPAGGHHPHAAPARRFGEPAPSSAAQAGGSTSLPPSSASQTVYHKMLSKVMLDDLMHRTGGGYAAVAPSGSPPCILSHAESTDAMSPCMSPAGNTGILLGGVAAASNSGSLGDASCDNGRGSCAPGMNASGGGSVDVLDSSLGGGVGGFVPVVTTRRRSAVLFPGAGGVYTSSAPEEKILSCEGFQRFCTVFDATMHLGAGDPVIFREPLRLVLDSLRSASPVEKGKGVRFLTNTSRAFNVHRLLDPYLLMLFQSQEEADPEILEYVVTSLGLIVENAPPRFIRHMLDTKFATSGLTDMYARFLGGAEQPASTVQESTDCYVAVFLGICIHIVTFHMHTNDVIAGQCTNLLLSLLSKAAQAGCPRNSRIISCRRTAALFTNLLDALIATLKHALTPPLRHHLSLQLCEVTAVAMTALGYSSDTPPHERVWGNPAQGGSIGGWQAHAVRSGSPPLATNGSPGGGKRTPVGFESEQGVPGEFAFPTTNGGSAGGNGFTHATAAGAAGSSGGGGAEDNPPPASSIHCLVSVLASFVSQSAASDDSFLFRQWCDTFVAMMPLLSSVLPSFAGASRATFIVVIDSMVEKGETAGCLSLLQQEVITASLSVIAQIGEYVLSMDEDAIMRESFGEEGRQIVPDSSYGEVLSSHVTSSLYPTGRRAAGSAHWDVSPAVPSSGGYVVVDGMGVAAAQQEAAESSQAAPSGGGRGWGPVNLLTGIFSGSKEKGEGAKDSATVTQAGKAAFCEGYDDFLAVLNRFVRASSGEGLGKFAVHTVSYLLQVLHSLHPWHFINSFVHRWSEQILLHSWKPVVEGPNESQEAYLFLLSLTPNVAPDAIVSAVVELSTEIVTKRRAAGDRTPRTERHHSDLGVRRNPSFVIDGTEEEEVAGMTLCATKYRGASCGSLDATTTGGSFAGCFDKSPTPSDPLSAAAAAGADAAAAAAAPPVAPPATPAGSASAFPAFYEVFSPDFIFHYIKSLTERGRYFTTFLKGKGAVAAAAAAAQQQQQQGAPQRIPLQTAEKLVRIVKVMPAIVGYLKEMTGAKDKDPVTHMTHAFAHPLCLRLLAHLVKLFTEISSAPQTYGQELSGVCRAFLADKKGNRLQDMLQRILETVPKLMHVSCCASEGSSVAVLTQNTAAPDALAAAMDLLSNELVALKSAQFLSSPDKIGPILAMLHQQYFSGIFRLGEDLPDRAAPLRKCHVRKINASLSFLVEAVRVFTPMAVWQLRAPVLEHVNDGQFFRVDHHTLTLWRSLYTALVGGSDAAVRSMIEGTLSRIQLPTGVGSVFLSAEKEAQNRARSLRRLAFLMACSGQHLSNAQLLTAILERLIESMKHYAEWPVVHRQIMMCFRAILHKTDAHSLAPFWPLIITELMHLLASPPKGDKGAGPLITEALKVIDVARVVLPSDFHIYRWIFVEGQEWSIQGPGDVERYVPLLERIKQKGDAVLDMKRAVEILQAVRVKRRETGSLRTALAVPERLCEDVAKRGLGVPEMITVLQGVCRGGGGLDLSENLVGAERPDLDYLSKAMDVDLADLHLLVPPAFFDHLLPFTTVPATSLPRVESNVVTTRTGGWGGFAGLRGRLRRGCHAADLQHIPLPPPHHHAPRLHTAPRNAPELLRCGAFGFRGLIDGLVGGWGGDLGHRHPRYAKGSGRDTIGPKGYNRCPFGLARKVMGGWGAGCARNAPKSMSSPR